MFISGSGGEGVMGTRRINAEVVVGDIIQIIKQCTYIYIMLQFPSFSFIFIIFLIFLSFLMNVYRILKFPYCSNEILFTT